MFDNTSWQIEDIKFVLNKFSSLIQWKGSEGEKVLHYGINNGFVITKFLFPHLPKNIEFLLCVESDGRKVEAAKKEFHHEKVQYVRIDANWRLLNKFHHIFSFYCIDELLEQGNLFNCFYKNLSPYGDLFLVTLDHHGFDFLHHQQVNLSGPAEGNSVCEQILDMKRNTLRRMLEESGFSDVRCEYFDRYQLFPNVSILKKSLKSYMASRNLPKDVVEESIFNLLAYQIEIGAVRYLGRKRKVIAVPYTMTFIYAKKIVEFK